MRELVLVVIAAHVVSVAAMLAMLLFADVDRLALVGSGSVMIRTVLLGGAIALDAVITGLVALFYIPARSARGRSRTSESGRCATAQSATTSGTSGSPWLHSTSQRSLYIGREKGCSSSGSVS